MNYCKSIVDKELRVIKNNANYFTPVKYSAQEEYYMLLESFRQFLRKNYKKYYYMNVIDINEIIENCFNTEFLNTVNFSELEYLNSKVQKYSNKELKYIVEFNIKTLSKKLKLKIIKWIKFKIWFKNKFRWFYKSE